MKEYYNLPVLYTEEERQRYVKWGIKKTKAQIPLMVLMIAQDTLVIVSTIVYLFWMVVLDKDSVPYGSIVFFNTFASKAAWLFSMIFSFLVIKPLDALIDFLLHKPEDPMMLRLEPAVDGVEYTLLRGKKTLRKGILSWQEWRTAVNPQTNEIFIERQRLKIGENNRKSIYPPHLQRPWLDQPAEKIVGTIRLGTIQKNMEGYLASLEEQKREAQWQSQNRI